MIFFYSQLCDHPKQYSFIWEIKRNSSFPAYLFGTIHVPYTKVWDSISQITKDAFNNCDRIIFELDLLNERVLQNLLSCQILKNRTRLIDIIPKEIYHRLERHLEYVKKEIPIWMAKHNIVIGRSDFFETVTKHWERKGPIWISIMLNSLTESHIKTQGIQVLDNFLAKEARESGKEISSVEKVINCIIT